MNHSTVCHHFSDCDVSGCLGDFIITIEHHALGGLQYQSVHTVEECATICKGMSKCVAFNFDRNELPYMNTSCWIHDLGNSIFVKQKTNVDLFTKKSCATEGMNMWIIYI